MKKALIIIAAGYGIGFTIFFVRGLARGLKLSSAIEEGVGWPVMFFMIPDIMKREDPTPSSPHKLFGPIPPQPSSGGTGGTAGFRAPLPGEAEIPGAIY